jgi:hypothetical protein
MNNWLEDYVDLNASTVPTGLSLDTTIFKCKMNQPIFKKPFTVDLVVSDGDETYTKDPKVGTIQKYKFQLTNS